MPNTSTMLSVSPKRPVDPLTLEALTLVERVARDADLDYFLIGAIARDILLNGVFGIDTGQETRDVDLAVALNTWSEFDAIKAKLEATGAFRADARIPHRLYHPASAGTRGYPLDLIPFGSIEQRPHEIAWPPDGSVVMNVAGYAEVRAAAIDVEIKSGLVLRVASLPGLAVLKVFAWADRGASDRRDALDLGLLLRSYADAGNEDRLFGDELDLLESLEYVMEAAAPRLLGQDAAGILTPKTREQLVAILNDAERVRRLRRDMAEAFRGTEDAIAEAEAAIGRFKMGLNR